MKFVFLILMGWVSTSAQAEDWAKETASFCAVNVEACLFLQDMKPVRTRAGHYHFTGAYLNVPGAEAVLLNRLISGVDTSEVRSALVPALQPFLATRPEMAEELYGAETDAGVRVQLVASMQDSRRSSAHSFLMRASRDGDARVRQTVASTVGFRDKDSRWLPVLESMLMDEHPSVRAMSARSLGWYGESRSFDALLKHLQDDEASVRLQVLSALERIDATALRHQPILDDMRSDSDSRVRHRAIRLKSD